MAPKRGGGSGGGGGGGVKTEETMKLSLYEEMKTSYTASAVVSAIFMVLLLLLFIYSISNQRRWRKVPQSRFLTMTIWCSLLYFVSWGLSFASFIATLVEATVFESWVLIPGFQSTFSMLAELLLIAVLYYILHNRLRAVGIHNKALVFVHWSCLVIMTLLSMVYVAGNWGYSATYLHDLKVDYYSADYWNPDYTNSKFYRVHVRNINAAFWVLRFVMQVEMIVLGVVILFKSKVNPGGLKGMVFFLIGPLITYTITPLTLVITTFKYWDETSYKPWLWLTPLEMGLEGFSEVVCISVICIFAVMTSHAQWELGTQGATQVAPVVGVYKPDVPVYPNQPLPPPPAPGYYVPQPAQGYYVPQDQYR